MDAKEPHYTAEQLRKEAVAVERMHGETLTVDWRNTQAAQLRAHADALEENARLKSKLIDYAADISNYQDRELSFDAWKQRAERAEAELAETRRDLQFIERWANHHGQKPNITPREVLSMIQHYPPILEITRSYEDGKVPNTPNPWAELAAEREMVNRLQIAVDGAAGLLTYAAYGADRCCNRPCSEVEGMVRRSTQMRAWVLKYGKWKMGIAHPETEAEISISIDAARRR